MAGPAGFADLINRKYDIQQEEASARAGLESAQGQSIAAKTPFENALTAAQANQTNETAKTVQPLANASITGTLAGATEAGARSNLFGAQTREINENELGTLPDQALQSLYRGLQHFSGAQATGANSVAGQPNGVPDANGTASLVSGAAIGSTPNVATGAASAAGNPAVAPIAPAYTGGIALAHPDTDINTVDPSLASDVRRRPGATSISQFAEGTTDVKPVPKPGDTQTSGTWGPGQNQTLRDRLFPKQLAEGTAAVQPLKKGTAAVKAKSAAGAGKGAQPLMAQPQASMPAPSQTGPALPMASPPASPVGGLAALLAAVGATTVPQPGKMPMPAMPQPQPAGKPNTDTVPAMLTPGEAVVNKQAVKHIPGGRQAIAKANAKGVMEQRGAPAKRQPMKGGAVTKKQDAGKNHVAVHIKMG